jgi:nucleoside diphosphate kinase
MIKRSTLSKKIAETALSCDSFKVVQPVKVGQTTWRNELLLFVKPEIFLVEEVRYIQNALDLVLAKLAAFDAHISGIVTVGGRILDQKEIMSQHYGFINRLSRSASQIVDGEDLSKIAEALDLSDPVHYPILGGHEYLEKYPEEDCFELDALWFTKKSVKIRSGFYVQRYQKGDEAFILVNGFHPAQLAHYTAPSHRVVLVLIHSDTDWAILRNQMVGATFPEKAVPESIRGTLYAQPEKFGLESVSIANNGVHLSAGPFEAMFEIKNFFGKVLDLDLKEQPALILREMMEAGISMEKALKVLDNPIITKTPKPIDLFTATEDVDTGEAIALYSAFITYAAHGLI